MTSGGMTGGGRIGGGQTTGWTRGAVFACQAGSILAVLAIVFVLFLGGGRWRIFGVAIRLDRPNNPIFILAACQGLRAWLVRSHVSWKTRLGAAARVVGWTTLVLLMLTLPVDRSRARHSSTPWRQTALLLTVGAFVLSLGLETVPGGGAESANRARPQREGDPASEGGASGHHSGFFALRRAFRLDVATLLFVGCALWALVAALASPFRPETFSAWASTWLVALGMFWAVRLAWTGERPAQALALLLVGALVLAIGIGGVQFLFGITRFDLAPNVSDTLKHRLASARAMGLSLHPNYLAVLLAGLLMFALALGIRAERRKRTVACYVLAAIGMGMLVLTRSRGGLIAAVCGAVFLAIASHRRMALPVLLVAGIALLSLAGAHRQRFLGLIRVVAGGQAPPELVGWRPILWKSAVTMSEERPILGWGTGQEVYETVFRRRFPEASYVKEAFHAHNLYLETAVETGFTGLGLFGILVIGVAWKGWKTRGWRGPAGRTLTLGAAAALFVFLLHGFVDYPLNRGTWLLFGVVLGILAGGDYTSEGSASGPPPLNGPDPKQHDGDAVHG